MTKLEQMAEEFSYYLDDDVQFRERRGLVEAAYIAGFKAARALAADLLDNALKVACIEVDQQDRSVLEYQVTRITQLGEDEAK